MMDNSCTIGGKTAETTYGLRQSVTNAFWPGCESAESGYALRVKFAMALLVYLLMGLALGCGILLTMRGNPWLLIAGFLSYVLLFAKIGCLPKKTH